MRLVKGTRVIPYIEIKGTIVKSFIPHSLCIKEGVELYRCFIKYGDRWIFMTCNDLEHIINAPKRFYVFKHGNDSVIGAMFMDMGTYKWPMWDMGFEYAHDFSEVKINGGIVNAATVCVDMGKGIKKWYYINGNGDFCGRHYPFKDGIEGSPVTSEDNEVLKGICRKKWESMKNALMH